MATIFTTINLFCLLLPILFQTYITYVIHIHSNFNRRIGIICMLGLTRGSLFHFNYICTPDLSQSSIRPLYHLATGFFVQRPVCSKNRNVSITLSLWPIYFQTRNWAIGRFPPICSCQPSYVQITQLWQKDFTCMD